MILLETDSLKPGFEAAAPVRHPSRPSIELVMPGLVLDTRMIAILKRLGVPRMWVRWPSLDYLDRQISTRVADLRRDVYSRLKSDFHAAQAMTVCVAAYNDYCTLVASLIMELMTNQSAGGAAVETASLHDNDHGLFTHSANVSYLSLSLGLRLQAYVARQRRYVRGNLAGDITNMGVGAMLHDIGKLKAPSTVELHEPVDQPPNRAYASHPRWGYDMLGERFSATARAVVLHHHQRFDGSGFPDLASVTRKRREGSLEGEKIHIFPRIVSLCDTFDHLCHEELGRPRPTVMALHELLRGSLLNRYDPVVLRALLDNVPPFALGHQVGLSDGRDAAVIALNKRRPCRPTVRPLEERNDGVRDIDLAQRTDLRIVRTMGVDVSDHLYELPPPKVPIEQWDEHTEFATSVPASRA